MALVTVSGHCGCPTAEVARIAAQRLGWRLLTATQITSAVESEFGPANSIPGKAWLDILAAVLARAARDEHLVIAAEGPERLSRFFPGLMLRVMVTAPQPYRAGSLMIDRRLERPAAIDMLREMERLEKEQRKKKFGRATFVPEMLDMVLNAEHLPSEAIAGMIASAIDELGLAGRGHLSAAAEAQLQFQLRLRLARHGIAPTGAISLPRKVFAHPSEEVFANLLDFYRIAWEYEPRSFSVQWDESGRTTEAFTPDFYLPEFDLYVELTTMKQSLVTKKNRKVRRLRELYPEVNIQVFYQKDFENLIFKYGLAGQLVPA